MANELVPVTHARYAYNALHGTELPAHNQLLNAEQAARINNHYNIEAFVGTHGIVSAEEPESYIDLLVRPTQQEYDEAAAVVAGMQSGDTLFIETFGFKVPKWEEPIPDISSLEIPEHLDFMRRTLAQMALEYGRIEVQQARRRLEESRRQYKISAWRYAAELAWLKGIQVVYADHDAFQKTSAIAAHGGKQLKDLRASRDETDQKLAWDWHHSREHSAVNIIKDWALDHLPPEGSQPPKEGYKPRLVLLFGVGHQKGIDKAFKQMGLNAAVTPLESTSLLRRRDEQAVYTLSRLIQLLAATIIEEIVKGTSPPKPPDEKPKDSE